MFSEGEKMELKDFFKTHKKVSVALSGGIDSSYLMYAAKKYGAEVSAYFVKSEFVPDFEAEDVISVAEEIGVQVKVLQVSALNLRDITKNGEDRCYFCKKAMFEAIIKAARSDGFDVILEGTNASDDVSDRPGFRAIGELSVISPFKICGLTKEEIRKLSKEAGISIWNKPSYSCLATRVAKGMEITKEKLSKIEKAERFLFSLGFSDFRVRLFGENSAKLEFNIKDKGLFEKNKTEVTKKLDTLFSSVTFDTEARR